jgi:2,3-bisphosphoglycerate-dependent phosphoglycerate mutase
MRERDFRSWEGRSYLKRIGESSDEVRHPDAETHEEMQTRVRRFMADHLIPALLSRSSAEPDSGAGSSTIVVVAHGLILNVLLRLLLRDFAPAEMGKMASPEHLSSWKNTGYLEARVLMSPSASPGGSGTDGAASVNPGAQPESLPHLTFRITRINCVEHLQGLKKTRGGIGSAQFDVKQKTMESFFRPSSAKRKPDGKDSVS